MKGDGDCAYRSFIMGLVYNVKNQIISPDQTKAITSKFVGTNRSFKGQIAFKELSKNVRDLLSYGAIFITRVLKDDSFSFSDFAKIMEDLDLSRAIIFTLRHLVAFSLKPQLLEMGITDEEMSPYLTMSNMGVFAGDFDLVHLGQIFSTKIDVFDLNQEFGGDRAFGDDSSSNIISMTYFSNHFDLLVDSWDESDSDTYKHQEAFEFEEISKFAY